MVYALDVVVNLDPIINIHESRSAGSIRLVKEHPDFLTAREAAEALGVRRDTLYAYVSRGQIHSEPGPDGRTSRYRRSDVEELVRRKALRRQPEKAVEGALHFGAPVLESALTRIDEGRLFYRGIDARELAATASVEEVAAWLWLGDRDVASTLFDDEASSGLPDPVGEMVREILQSLGDPWALETFQVVLPVLGLSDPSAWAARDAMDRAKVGARILRSMIEIASSRGDRVGRGEERDLAATLGNGWGVEPSSLLGACLVLSADHELNVSAFTARCVASAGSPLHSVVAAGLAALQGPRHGGHTRRVEALLREAGSPDGARGALADRLRRGEGVPGFGHLIYPDGDPRYEEIRRRLGEAPAGEEAVAWAEALEAAGRELLGERPTVDVGLVLAGRALGLPRDAPLTLFALGRTIGWIAHAIEQAESGRLIRPRARYVGPAAAL